VVCDIWLLGDVAGSADVDQGILINSGAFGLSVAKLQCSMYGKSETFVAPMRFHHGQVAWRLIINHGHNCFSSSRRFLESVVNM
jgi:hypothetical protein